MITAEEIQKIDQLTEKYIRKSTCALTEAANIEFRKGLKKRIIELLETRDKTQPYNPVLQKK
jgi:spore coat protein CotF